MKALIFAATLLLARTAVAENEIGASDSVRWLVDMEAEYPLGIICAKLHVYFMPTPAAFDSSLATLVHSVLPQEAHFSAKISESNDLHMLELETGQYHYGNRYLVNIPVRVLADATSLARDDPPYRTGRLTLACEAELEQPAVALADSDPFSFAVSNKRKISLRRLLNTRPKASIRDVSDPDLYLDETKWCCWITKDYPDRSLLINGHITDARSFVRYVRTKHAEITNYRRPFEDNYRQPVDRVLAVDDRLVRERGRLQQQEQGRSPFITSAKLDRLLETIVPNTVTSVIHSNAIPILREIWSAADYPPDYVVDSAAVEAELRNFFGEQMAVINLLRQQYRQSVQPFKALRSVLDRALRNFALVTLNLWRLDRWGMIAVDRLIVRSKLTRVIAYALLTAVGGPINLGLYLRSLLRNSNTPAASTKSLNGQFLWAAKVVFGQCLPIDVGLAGISLIIAKQIVDRQCQNLDNAVNMLTEGATQKVRRERAIDALEEAIEQE